MTEYPAMPKQDMLALYQDDELDRAERIHYPYDSATEAITEAFHDLRREGEAIVLVDGAFDVPQPNHEHYLRHCRAIGAAAFVEMRGYEPTPDTLRRVLGSQAVKLAVTVDADHKISAKKGGKAAKGGVQRPVYPWEARADRIAGYSFRQHDGLYRPVVDLVTVEGDPIHEGTALESSLTLAHHLHEEGLLDRLVVYGEHDRTAREARELAIPVSVIPDHTDYVLNPQTGNPYSSSDIIRRAQGTPVANPLTRPSETNTLHV